jgi:Ni/Co efflux regulator RcnB
MKRLMSAALAAATLIAPMSIATTASAQSYRDRDYDRDGRYDRDRDRDRDRDYDRDRGRRDNDWNRGRHRGHDRDRWDDRRHNGYYYNNRWYYGPPPSQWRDEARYDYRAWRRGDRLPRYYRDHYRVVDYRDYRRLRAPPRGYHYVRDDRGELLLVGIATGVILGIIASQ